MNRKIQIFFSLISNLILPGNELLDQYTDPEQRAKIEEELRKELAKVCFCYV